MKKNLLTGTIVVLILVRLRFVRKKLRVKRRVNG